MTILPKCSQCGLNIAVLTPICSSCEKENEKQKVLRKMRKDQERAEASKKLEDEKERERLLKAERLAANLIRPFARLFARYIDSTIKVNYDGPDSYEASVLIGVNDDHFSIQSASGFVIHIPHSQVLHFAEAAGTAPLVRVMQLVIYKGSTSVGISVPIGH